MMAQIETAPPVAKPGPEWSGKRLALWSRRKLGYLVSIEGGCTPSKANPAYWAGDIPWVSPKDMKTGVISDSEDHVSEEALCDSSLRLIEPPVVLIVVRGMILAHSFPVAITTVPVTVNQDMKALRPRPGCLAEYLAYLLEGIRSTVLSLVDDSAHGTKCLRTEIWKSIDVAIPPIEQQVAIIQLLDRETARIDALIEKKQRQIELLHEKRAALISHAVTKGLDSKARMSNSGVIWAGQIPAHWAVLKMRRITLARCDGPFGSGLKSEHYVDNGVRVVRLQNIRFGWFDDSDRAFIDPEHYRKLGDHDVGPGDVLIAGLGDDNNPVGRACIAPPGLGPAMVKADCFRFRVDQDVAHPGYIALQLSVAARALGGALAAGTTRARMNLSETTDRDILLPTLAEQQAIVEFLHRETEKIDALVEKITLSINRLREYRTAFVSAAVTGKINVHQEVA